MPRFLITLSLGPVQSLIADARRTRDLWCGSWILSEAARAAARALHKRRPGCLIFPAPGDPDTDLEPRDDPGEGANIANVLRAEVTLADGAAVRGLCDDARSAATVRVKELGDRALQRLGRSVREEVWAAQIGDIIESFAAWVEIRENDEGYANAGRDLGAALSARKATRDFRPCERLSVQDLQKSSLDGARETVLLDEPAREPARRRLALTPGEQLDALGVIKRLAGDAEQFTPWPRIAADSWIERLTPDEKQPLEAAYEPLVEAGCASRVRGNSGIYSALPFDGHLLYPSRLENALAQARAGDASATRSPETLALEELSGALKNVIRTAGAPVPYAAILQADGDRMGRLLSRARSAEHSREISSALYGFASHVRHIVRDHRGHTIYAGGDDVLALLPLEPALTCASALADCFHEALRGIAEEMQVPEHERPTLSVGLGIGYVIDPLGMLRAVAERAERHAKGDATEHRRHRRNALAIRLRIRSGTELCWRAQWSDEKALEALKRFTKAYRAGELPTRAAYDLRDVDRRLAWLRGSDDETARGMRKAEVERMLYRARRDGGSRTIPADLRALVRERADHQPLTELADTLIIARWLSARTAADVGE